MTNNVKSFLIKIASDSNLVDKFKNDPKAVMNNFNLSKEEQRYILDKDNSESDNDIAKGYLTVVFAPAV